MTAQDRIDQAIEALDLVTEYLKNAPGADITRGNLEALIEHVRAILTNDNKCQGGRGEK
jgi:hypothetical protein